MRVTNEKWITMEFDGARAPIHAKQIGKGRWTTAYLDRESRRVYLFTVVRPDGTTDYAKEMLASIGDGNLHLPRVSRFDDIDGAAGERYRVYEIGTVHAADREVWQGVEAVQAVAEDC